MKAQSEPSCPRRNYLSPSARAYARHALRLGSPADRLDAPAIYCAQVESLRDIGLPTYAKYFTVSTLELRVLEASVDIEYDRSCSPEDLHDLLILCDDVIRELGGYVKKLARTRESIVGAYKRKQRDIIPITPLDHMLIRVHQDEFTQYWRAETRVQTRYRLKRSGKK